MAGNEDASGVDVRKGQAPDPHPREVFRQRFLANFFDPIYRKEQEALDRIEALAWEAFKDGHKAPVTRKAGPGFKDPDYDLSVEWYETREKLRAAQARWHEPTTRSRVLVIACASRNDGTCPGEVSKTWRLARVAQQQVEATGLECDFLDLSLLTSDYRRHIHPCKACVSTAMPLCHWPCSCYPNHGQGQVNDWMAEIYERWVSAHGVLLVTPTYWYQVASPLKLMMDRLVCADGGNPDPTRTHGKDAKLAKEIELEGWDYPRHLAGRLFSVVVHGDVEGAENVRRSVADWLRFMHLVPAGPLAELDRYIGYWQPYATSHDELDRDRAVQEEVRNAARTLLEAVQATRSGRQVGAGSTLTEPRQK
jgi:multimeric flavodoxin WrbA